MTLAYTIVGGVIAVVVASGGIGLDWVLTQAGFAADQPWTGEWWVITGGAFLLVALLSALLILARPYPRLAAIGRLWTFAALVAALLSPTRAIAPSTDQLALAIQAVALLAVAIGGWMIGRFRRDATDLSGIRRSGGAAWLALCAGGLVLLPWVFLSSVGDPADLAIGIAVAASAAACAGVLAGDRYWGAFAASSIPVRVLAGGSALGVGLLLLLGGTGSGGVTMLAMMTVSACGFVIAALVTRASATGRIVAAAVAPALAGPLLFADADEFLPLVFGPDFTSWQFPALAVSIVIAWVLAAVIAPWARRWSSAPAVAAGCVVIVAATIAVVHFSAQPGFHGEELLVVMKDQANLSDIDTDDVDRPAIVRDRLIDTAEEGQRDLRAELDRRGLAYTPMYVINAIRVDASLMARQWLADRSDVADVLLNPRNRAVRYASEPMTGGPSDVGSPQPNIEQVGAPGAWERGATGAGIVIGIPDSGVDGRHPALASSYRGGDDSWADPVGGTAEPTDPNGHGTHVAALAVGSDGVGVAPDAQWMACANLPRNAGNPADYLECLQFMLAPYAPGEDPFADGDPSRAPNIVSNSWACPRVEGCSDEVLSGAVTALDAAGIFVVVAAGNSGPECGSADTEPANFPDSFTVGAVDGDGRVTSFSSRGPATMDGREVAKPDVVAPGQDSSGSGVLSALPGGGYGRLFGTSMAAPHVAGVVALLWSAAPELVGDTDATRDLLRQTARPADLEGVTCAADASGAGIVDVDAALDALDGQR